MNLGIALMVVLFKQNSFIVCTFNHRCHTISIVLWLHPAGIGRVNYQQKFIYFGDSFIL